MCKRKRAVFIHEWALCVYKDLQTSGCVCEREMCMKEKRENVSASLFEDTMCISMYIINMTSSGHLRRCAKCASAYEPCEYTCTAVSTHANLYACMHSVDDACWWMCVSMWICAGNDSQVSHIATTFLHETPVWVSLFCKSDLANETWRFRVSFPKEALYILHVNIKCSSLLQKRSCKWDLAIHRTAHRCHRIQGGEVK